MAMKAITTADKDGFDPSKLIEDTNAKIKNMDDPSDSLSQKIKMLRFKKQTMPSMQSSASQESLGDNNASHGKEQTEEAKRSTMKLAKSNIRMNRNANLAAGGDLEAIEESKEEENRMSSLRQQTLVHDSS